MIKRDYSKRTYSEKVCNRCSSKFNPKAYSSKFCDSCQKQLPQKTDKKGQLVYAWILCERCNDYFYDYPQTKKTRCSKCIKFVHCAICATEFKSKSRKKPHPNSICKTCDKEYKNCRGPLKQCVDCGVKYKAISHIKKTHEKQNKCARCTLVSMNASKSEIALFQSVKNSFFRRCKKCNHIFTHNGRKWFCNNCTYSVCELPSCQKSYKLRTYKYKGEVLFQRYCSSKCSGIAQTIEDSTRYPYPNNWPTIAKQIRKRDDYKCKLCNRKKKIFEKELEIHHIIKIRSNGSNETNNLITLCKQCHTKVENDPDMIPKLQAMVR